MKTFKELIKDINKETKNSGVIPEPIHFKHVDRDIATGSGIIPSPIHFKRVGETNTGSGVIPEPIHFKYVSPILGSTKKQLRDILESDIDNINPWNHVDDNVHHGVDVYAQGNKLSEHHDTKTVDINSLKSYTGEYSKDVADHMLGKGPGLWNKSLVTHVNNIIDGMHNTIRNNPLAHDNVHTYSGVGFDPEKHLDEDGCIRSPAFISSTLNKDIARSFASKNKYRSSLNMQHILHFHLRKDDPAMLIHKYSEFPDEHEVVISPTKLKHHGYKEYHVPHGDNIRVHKVSIVKE